MLTLLAIGGGLLIVAWFVRRTTARPALAAGQQAGSEIERFVLRVEPPGDESIRLGTSIEIGDASNEPDLASEEVVLVDDADHTVIVPAGQLLRVRTFEGAARAPLETVTTATTVGRRYSFDVDPGTKFWILDAPSWHACLGATDPTRRSLPPRAEGYEITTRQPPEPDLDGDGAITVTLANFTAPLWMHGLMGAEEWLLGERTRTDRVAIVAFTDPFQEIRESEESKALVGSACFQILDAVWLETTARATVGVPIIVSRYRIYAPQRIERGWDSTKQWREKFAADTAFVWGVGRRSIDDGFDVRVRSMDDPTEVALGGTLPEVRRTLVAALETRGIVRSNAAPSVCSRLSPLPVGLDGAYAKLCEQLCLMFLGHPDTQGVPVRAPQTQRNIVDLAKQLADAAPRSEVALLVWIVAAICAHACGGLSIEQRSAVIAFVRSRRADDDPICRLAPAIYYKLGELGDAVDACRTSVAWSETIASAYRGTVDSDAARYLSWLEKVNAKATAA